MKCDCEINEEVQKQLNKKPFIVGLLCLIVGIIGVLVYLVIGTIFIEIKWLNYFLFSSIPFGIGLVLILTIAKTNKSIQKNKLINHYEFDEKFMNISTTKNGEEIGTSKIYYKDLVKVRETKNYLFLYVNRASAFPIKMDNLEKAEIEIIKYWIKNSKKELNENNITKQESNLETSENN